MKNSMFAAAVAAMTMLAWAPSAGAVDGTIEINQAKVLAAGGFPYTIRASGSYRLTGNLTVSSTSTNAIDVNTSHVTIDLNGFAISGPGNSSTAAGISGAVGGNSLTVENGTIIGFRYALLIGTDAIVKSVHAGANTNGIVTGSGSVIQGCTANGNATGVGISAGGGSVISGNTANSNATGITCAGSGCLISGNVLESNSGVPISLPNSSSAYDGNVVVSNGSNVSGGFSLGHNLCNGGAC